MNIYQIILINYRLNKFQASKAVKQSIINAETAFKRFFKGQSKYPNFKKKHKSDVKVYFVKNSASQIINFERRRIKLPILNWIKLKEKGYLPQSKKALLIRSGTISYRAVYDKKFL